jgi:hypothetical protein
MEKSKHILIKKIKGMFFNHNGRYIKEYVDNTTHLFRKLNYITMSLLQQSIHHVTFYTNKYDELEKIQINFRPLGIKPEDIDGFLLEKKKQKEGLSHYEQILYGMWTTHYDKNKTYENKMINDISKQIYKLKQKWSDNTMTPFKDLSEEELNELKEESKSIYLSTMKY